MGFLGRFFLFTFLATGAVTGSLLCLALGWDAFMGSSHSWPTSVWLLGLLGLASLPITVGLTVQDHLTRPQEESEGLNILG